MEKEEVIASPMTLLPPHPSKCQECAADHKPQYPHNAQSLFYQVKFKMQHGRDATWKDAMEHCTPETKKDWTKMLEALGVDVEGGAVNPAKTAEPADVRKA